MDHEDNKSLHHIITRGSSTSHVHPHQHPQLSFGCWCLRLKALEPVVQHFSTFLLVKWNTTSEVPKIDISTQAQHGSAGGHLQLLSLLSWDVGAHIPRVGNREECLVAQLCHLAVPVLLSLSGGVEVSNLLLAKLRQCIDDPVTLALNTARTVRESSRALCAVNYTSTSANSSLT